MDLAVILNGPPGCGKDTLAEAIGKYNFIHRSFKKQLYIETARHFGVELEAFIAEATDRKRKEMPWFPLYQYTPQGNLERTLTPREALIYVSEELIKPTEGKDFFGKAAAEACLKDNVRWAVFSDGGFEEEIEPLVEAFGQVVVVRLHREGYTFEGDSRRYLEGFPNTHDLALVDGDVEGAVNGLCEVLEPYACQAVALSEAALAPAA